MKTAARSFVSILLGLAAAASAQKLTLDDWQPIPAEELALKDNPDSPGAKALILFREVFVDDVKSTEFHHYRKKILTEDGKSYADIQIPYVEKVFSIENIKARVVQPDGKSVNFSGQIFDQLVLKARNVKFQAKTFTLPEVRIGSIIEYAYTTRSRQKAPDVLQHPSNYIILEALSMPTAQWVIHEDLFTRRARFSIRPLPSADIYWSVLGVPKEMMPRKQPDGTLLMELEHIPGFEEEDFMPPDEALKSRVDFFYGMGPLRDARDYWGSYARARAIPIEQFIGDSKNVRRVVEETVAPGDSPETKLRKLYDRAQQFRYLSFEAQKTDKEQKQENLKANKNVDELLKRRYAYANEINLLFIALARAAGFESAPALVTARDRRIFRMNLLNPAQLNAMLVWVRSGSKEYFFDPATYFCPFDLLPWNEAGTSGFRISKLGADFVNTPVPKSADAVITRKATLALDGEGNLQGQVQVTFQGQEALSRRLTNRQKDEAARRTALEDEIKEWLPAGSTATLAAMRNWDRTAEPVQAEFTVRIPNHASSAGRRMLVPLGVFQAHEKRLFVGAGRRYPVYFPYPFQRSDEITIELPASHKLESVPAPRSNTASFGSYSISALSPQNQGATLKLERKMAIETTLLREEFYSELRNLYSSARAGDAAQVVLQNANQGK